MRVRIFALLIMAIALLLGAVPPFGHGDHTEGNAEQASAVPIEPATTHLPDGPRSPLTPFQHVDHSACVASCDAVLPGALGAPIGSGYVASLMMTAPDKPTGLRRSPPRRPPAGLARRIG